MQSGATFELVLAGGLIIVPARPYRQPRTRHLLYPYPFLILYVHLLATENEALLCWGNAFLLLDTLLDA